MPRRLPHAADTEPIEHASRDELEHLQLQRLRWSIRHAYDRVAPYRAKCQSVEAHPDDLVSLGDLVRFPFTIRGVASAAKHIKPASRGR